MATKKKRSTSKKKAASSKQSGVESITSLGVALRRRGESEWSLDLSHLKLFKGLSVVARLLGDDILEQSRIGEGDIIAQRRVIADITPELASLVSSLSIYARSGVLRDLPTYHEEFQMQLRTVFGTLQRPRWGNILFPELFGSKHEPKALLFPFHLHYAAREIDYFFLVERDLSGGFLRITVERDEDSRLNLAGIAHRTVDDLDRRTYLQGLTRITESVYQGMMRECENFRTEYTDNARRHSHFFNQLRNVGLSECDNLTMRWPSEKNEYLVRSRQKHVTEFLKRVFIVLEDREVVRLLQDGSVIEMRTGDDRAFLDLSRRNSCLNVSLFQRRESLDLDYYLDRMPGLKQIAAGRSTSFSGLRVFLIHHITGEILATIKAIDNMNADFLSVLFVKYAGVVPPDYLETLLTQPEEKFRFSGLQKIDQADRIEGYYRFSQQYTTTAGLESLITGLDDRKYGFYDAMQLAAGHLFFLEALLARKNKQGVLLIEDGGYLAPELNRMALEGKTLRQTLDAFLVPLKSTKASAKSPEGAADLFAGLIPSENELKMKLGDWLAKLMPGSVEHTRNGYNRLLDVMNKHKRLQFPACSIAVSDVKRNRESEEVSISILHAIESILHGHGLVFSERRALVLGSRGAIGRNLMEDLSAKLGPRNIFGVDSVLKKEKPPGPWVETTKLDELPENLLYDLDMIIGVIGTSILTKKELEQIILRNKRPYIFFASGSTKTAEFTHLSEWIRELQKQKRPKIGGVPVELGVQPVRDPQTAHIVASRVRIFFQPEAGDKKNAKLKNVTRDLYLLGGLTPINFLFYGVPTETMDPILGQLIQVAAGLVERVREKAALPSKLLAVDGEVDADARLLR